MICLNVTENASSRPSSQEESSCRVVSSTEEYIDEYVNVPIPPPVPSEPSQAGPSCLLEPAGVNIQLDQMAQILATTFRQLRESTVSIERARKLGTRNMTE